MLWREWIHWRWKMPLQLVIAHIAIPLLAALVVLLWRATTRSNVDWRVCNEIAIELSILAIGSTGAIFSDLKILTTFGALASMYSIILVLVDIALAGVLVGRSKWRVNGVGEGGVVTFWQGAIDLFIGSVGVSLTGFMIAVGMGVKVWGL
jgi:membrane-associated HD superfamily phosphohydrolase